MSLAYAKTINLWKRDLETKLVIPSEYSEPEFENVNYWQVTEKIDGRNMRIIFEHPMYPLVNVPVVRIGGRTERSRNPSNLVSYMESFFTQARMSLTFPDAKEVILFGEGIGTKIQGKNHPYSDKPNFILFDVWVDGNWQTQERVREIAWIFCVRHAPVIFNHVTKEDIINYLLDKPNSLLGRHNHKDFVMEGIIARSDPLMLFRNGKVLKFKLKINDMIKAGLVF